jgi:mannose-6-phosphate isomerase-like protein (cupin superfamily)
MKITVLDTQKLKKFNDEKRHRETIWSDKQSNINLLCMKQGQEITTHTHHGNHVWIVMEGQGELISAGEKQIIEPGKIVIVPPLVDHAIRNAGTENLVIASITAQGD